jgi:Fic family protein
MIDDFYSQRAEWPARVERVEALLDEAALVDAGATDQTAARRRYLIEAVHASTVMEGNRLTPAQAASVVAGDKVDASAQDVREMRNAWKAYTGMGTFDPASVDDFLRAHAMLVYGLGVEANAFRTVDIEITTSRGRVLHAAPRYTRVPRLVGDLFAWAAASDGHPLVVSSAVHFMIEDIHPFRDGNGRIGRLWQTLLLSRWNPMLAWLPIETVVLDNQPAYNQALQASHEPDTDAAPFIGFMLDAVEAAVTRFLTDAAS